MLSGDVESNPGPAGGNPGPSSHHDSQFSEASIDGIFEIVKLFELGQVQFSRELREVEDQQVVKEHLNKSFAKNGNRCSEWRWPTKTNYAQRIIWK